MHFLKRLILGIIITNSLLFTNCEDRISVSEELESSAPNSSTVIGSVYWESGRQYIHNATVWLTDDNFTACGNTPYKTKTNADGNFQFEVPAGSYIIHACGVIYYTSSSIVVSSETPLDIGELRISEIKSDLCKSCY